MNEATVETYTGSILVKSLVKLLSQDIEDTYCFSRKWAMENLDRVEPQGFLAERCDIEDDEEASRFDTERPYPDYETRDWHLGRIKQLMAEHPNWGPIKVTINSRTDVDLFNGYHRLFAAILRGIETIQAEVEYVPAYAEERSAFNFLTTGKRRIAKNTTPVSTA